MEGRLHDNHIYYMEGDPDHPPVLLHQSFSAQTEEYNLLEYLRLAKEYERTYKEWTPWWTEADLEYKLEQHRIALQFEHDNSWDTIKEKLIALEDTLFEKGKDIDQYALDLDMDD